MSYSDFLIRAGKKYRSYIGSIEWKQKKEEVFREKGSRCERCNSEEDLHVHHSSYRFLGEEPIGYLFVLCEKCHSLFHEKYNLNESMLRKTLNFVFGKRTKQKKEYIAKYNLQ